MTAGHDYCVYALAWGALSLFTLTGCETAHFADGRVALIYDVAYLDSIDGAPSQGYAINEQGWVAGYTEVTGKPYRHATLWHDGEVFDLGTLADGDDPANSSVPWAGLSADGTVAGISQTSNPDPLGAAWSCSAFFPEATAKGPVCVGVVWQGSNSRALPTLGGNHGFAAGINDRNQIVGWAEMRNRDRTCNSPQVLQFQGALWELGDEGVTVSVLPPLDGHSASAATAINNRGEIVGISGACDNAVGRFSAIHAVLWRNGKPQRVGDLGGRAWNTPMAVNDSGEVVGFANLPGSADGAYNGHAFYWNERDGVLDLGTLDEDRYSQAQGINNNGLIVGVSFGNPSNRQRAVLWQNGRIEDLNDLVAPGYAGTLTDARDINNSGEITGTAMTRDGSRVAYIARPRRDR